MKTKTPSPVAAPDKSNRLERGAPLDVKKGQPPVKVLLLVRLVSGLDIVGCQSTGHHVYYITPRPENQVSSCGIRTTHGFQRRSTGENHTSRASMSQTC
jgi:hypothetical protein